MDDRKIKTYQEFYKNAPLELNKKLICFSQHYKIKQFEFNGKTVVKVFNKAGHLLQIVFKSEFEKILDNFLAQ